LKSTHNFKKLNFVQQNIYDQHINMIIIYIHLHSLLEFTVELMATATNKGSQRVMCNDRC